MDVEKRGPVWMLLEMCTHHVLHDHVTNASKIQGVLKRVRCTLREVRWKKNFRKTGHSFPVWVRLLEYVHANLSQRYGASARRAMCSSGVSITSSMCRR